MRSVIVTLRTLLALAATLPLAACGTHGSKSPLPAVANAVSPEAGIVSAGRLARDDVANLREAGIRHVIDLTPDAETPGFDEATAVDAAGLAYDNLPLAGAADLTRENVQAFDALLVRADRPVLVHCGSGNRVGAMAALRAAWLENRPVEEAIAIGKSWGLAGLEGAVRERLGAGR
jgi:uncharacterized protein (TIGR01244 family)